MTEVRVTVVSGSNRLFFNRGSHDDMPKLWGAVGVPVGTELVQPLSSGFWEMSQSATRTGVNVLIENLEESP